MKPGLDSKSTSPTSRREERFNTDPDSDEYDPEEGGMTITLANGKTRTIDEMTTYVRATTP